MEGGNSVKRDALCPLAYEKRLNNISPNMNLLASGDDKYLLMMQAMRTHVLKELLSLIFIQWDLIICIVSASAVVIVSGARFWHMAH